MSPKTTPSAPSVSAALRPADRPFAIAGTAAIACELPEIDVPVELFMRRYWGDSDWDSLTGTV
jgi:hypothetical protein